MAERTSERWLRGLNRRELFRVGLAAGALTYGCRPGSDNGPPDGNGDPDPMPGVVVRRDANNPNAAPFLQTYREAVDTMRGLPEDDPFSWTRQAQIHNSFCPHGNWFFLPWHRAYLAAFENAIREVSGDNGFALPFWDWTNHRQIPAPFWGASNPLADDTRTVGPSDSLPDEDVGQPIINSILRETNFQLFASFQPRGQDSLDPRWQRAPGGKAQFERTPHDGVHVWIGGNMVTFMSPLDPIFWLHHCNIDRIWAQWNGRGRRNTSDSLWRDFTFNGNFFGRDRQPFDAVVRDYEETSALGYRYDGVGAGAGPESLMTQAPEIEERFAVEVAGVARLNQVLALPVQLSEAATAAALAASPEAALAGEQTRLLALLHGVHPPADPNVRVRVFLNCGYLDPTISTDDPHYVGSFGFFGDPRHHGEEDGMSYVFDLTETLERLEDLGEVSQELTVQIMPIPFDGRAVTEAQIETGSLEILRL